MQELFSELDLQKVLRQQTSKAVAAAGRVLDDEIGTDASAAAARVVAKWDLASLEVDAAGVEVSRPVEATVSASDGFGARFQAPALKVKFHVPFRGAASLFLFRASTYSMSGGLRANVGRHELLFELVAREFGPDEINVAIESTLARLDEAIRWTNDDLARWRPDFTAAVRETVNGRARAARSADDAVTGLRFKLRD